MARRTGCRRKRTRDYFAARAKGGVGLITVGATGIDHHHPDTRLLKPANAFRALDAHTLSCCLFVSFS